MSALSRLLKVGSMADSLGVYVPAMLVQKGLSLGRVLLFTYIMDKVQFDLWGLGMMIFNLGASVATLGSNHGLVRYVSAYEVRGQLAAFYRRARWGVLLLGAALTAVALACSEPLTSLFIVSRSSEGAEVAYAEQLRVCWAAVANGLMLALYANMLGFFLGMRAYRAVSLVEVFFSVVFTGAGVVVLVVSPTAGSLLLAHLGAVLASLVLGIVLLQVALSRPEGRADRAGSSLAAPPEAALPIPSDTEDAADAMPTPVTPAPAESVDGHSLWRVLAFGLVSLPGGLLWQGLGYVSFWMTSRRAGEEEGAVFFAFQSLGQLVLFLANAVWAVVFSHVARRWESDDRKTAMFALQIAYKAIAIALMAMTIVAYLTAPLWVKILRSDYHHGQRFLGGILMFFQTVTHVALMTILAKLHERPIVIALAAVASGVANYFLAVWWMGPGHDPQGAAWAAGVGTYLGAGIVTAAYFAFARVKLHLSTYLVLASPVVLLLPVWAAGAAWACVCAVAVFTNLLFAPREKEILVSSLRRFFTSARRMAA